MDDEKKSFLISEYLSLRQEVLDTLKEVPANEKIALVFSGAYWAWVLTNISMKSYLLVAAWVPGILAILFMLRAVSFNKKFGSFHSYLLKVENQLNLGGLGWETHIEKSGKRWFVEYNRAFWPALIIGNFSIGIFLLILEYFA